MACRDLMRASNTRTDNIISINALKYAVLLFSLVAAMLAFKKSTQDSSPCHHSHSLLFTNNIVSELWIIKGAKTSQINWSSNTSNTELWLSTQWRFMLTIFSSLTASLLIAFHISLTTDPSPIFFKISQDFPQLKHCRCFHSDVELTF